MPKCVTKSVTFYVRMRQRYAGEVGEELLNITLSLSDESDSCEETMRQRASSPSYAFFAVSCMVSYEAKWVK